MIADSSVWIDYFNGVDVPETELLDENLYRGDVELVDIILTEVLQGFKKNRDFQIAKTLLTKLHIYDVLGKEIAIQSAENFRMLRRQGITIRKTIDVIIATFCIEYSKPLLASDRDFELIASMLPLRLSP
jgi:predicted nucleic acid-binding protein